MKTVMLNAFQGNNNKKGMEAKQTSIPRFPATQSNLEELSVNNLDSA
jgi:hypothetical protein